MACHNLNTSDLSNEAPQLAEGILGHFPHCGMTHDNLKNERDIAEHHLQAVGRIDNSAKAGALLHLGIICLLQGEAQVAFERFRNAAAISYHDPRAYFTALCYGLQCLFMTYRWSLDGRLIPADEMDPLYNLEKALPYWVDKINEVKRCLGSSTLGQLAYVLEQQRCILFTRDVVDQPSLSTQQLQMASWLERNVQFLGSGELPFQKVAPLLLEVAGVHYQAQAPHAIEIVGDVFRRCSQINDLVGMAHCEMKLGDFECCSTALPEAWGNVLRPGLDSTVSIPLDQSLGFSPLPARIDKSATHYDTARTLFERVGFRRGMAMVNLRYGYLATLRARYGDAVDHYRRALEFFSAAIEVFSNTGDIIAFQTARAHSILCRVGVGQLPEDRATAEEIGVWGRTRGSISYTMGLGLFFSAQARRWLTDEGDYERALAAFRLAESLLDCLGLQRAYTTSVLDHLSVHDMLGEHDRFTITCEHVLKACRLLYERRGSPLASWAKSRATHVLQRVINRAIQRENPDEIASAVARIQLLYPKRPQEAILSNLVSLINKTPSGSPANPDVEAIQDISSDTTTQSSTQAAEFLKHVFRAQRSERHGDMNTAQAEWNLAEVKAHESEDSHEKELLLARVSAGREEYDKAATHLNSYFKLRLGAAESMRQHGLNLSADLQQLLDGRRKQVYEALLPGFVGLSDFNRAEEILGTLNDLYGGDWWRTGDAVANLAAAAAAKEGVGQFPAASTLYGMAMQNFEDRRGRLSLDEYKLAIASNSLVQGLYFKAARTAVKWHESLASSTLQSQHLEDAFRNLERGKTRSLLDLMAAGTLLYGQTEPSDIREWDEYRKTGIYVASNRAMLGQQYSMKGPDEARISKLEKDISEAERRLSRLEEVLFADKSPVARRFVTTTDVTDIRTLCSQLDDDTVVLQYAYRNDDLIAWAITTDGMLEVSRQPVREIELELRARRYREMCEASIQDAADGTQSLEHGQWLADRLLPFRRALDKFHIIIVAYRALHSLPFHALPWRGGLLLATHSVSYLPSASSISYLQSDRTSNTGLKILSVGNPSGMMHENIVSGRSRSLKELRYSESESRYIGSINAESRSLCGHEATKEAVTENIEQYDVLHFATHGILCTEVPMMSSVALADGKELTVSELMGRRLRASLVVLSACDTGVGRLTDGDDIIGFSRALLAVGVKNVVVSLWPVDDLATSFLMKAFYGHLMKGETGAVALREAQLAVRRSTQKDMEMHALDIQQTCGGELSGRSIAPEINPGVAKGYHQPRFWAPFIFIGVR
ncbi:CHAT domain-containing protein [Dactylonectria macrodidyma]|uniref:CHAT domain-containing protein n=1 Tax=Dactylonectria macrodidyma TaxID=307937 RepID=A0A9P9DSP0_9HYPO|nr:CHAT domain-containing protein [Dactylonectria macrodidyma]